MQTLKELSASAEPKDPFNPSRYFFAQNAGFYPSVPNANGKLTSQYLEFSLVKIKGSSKTTLNNIREKLEGGTVRVRAKRSARFPQLL